MTKESTLKARITRAQEERLSKLATELGVTPSAVVRLLLDKAVVRPGLVIEDQD